MKDKLENRLKTLEDKVKFIMENTDKEIFEQIGMQEADSKWVKLQDLWDEQNEKYLEKELIKEFIKPTVKECRCLCHKGETIPHHKDYCPCESTDKSEKIEEIISELNKRFWNRDSKIYHEASDRREILVDTKFLESWLRDRLKQL